MKPAVLLICLLALLFLIAGCDKKSSESDNDTVKKPRFLPESGTYETGQYMSIQCGTEDAEIRYTLDTTEPTLSSPLYTQSLVMPDFFINHSNYCVVKAKAFRNDLLPSPTATATYTVNYTNTVATPVFNPAEGSFDYCPVNVTISCATPGVQIRYTTDGTEPNYTSTLYGLLSSVPITTNTNLKAKAFKDGWNCSAVASSNITQRIYEVAVFPTSSPALDVEVSGNYAYVAENGGNLRIYDISDPNQPEEVTAYYLSPYIKAVAVKGDYAFVATSSTLYAIDVSTPAAPVIISTVGGLSAASEIEVRDSYAYVADIGYGLKIFDISDPANLTPVGGLSLGSYTYGLCLEGDYAYVANAYAGFKILNVSNPSSPALVYSTDTPGLAYDVTINGNYLYVADFSQGIRIYQLTTPTTPVFLGYSDSPDICIDVQVSGNLAYSADGSYGVRIIDLSVPASPVQLGYCHTETATDLQVVGNYIYLADDMGGFRVIYCNLD